MARRHLGVCMSILADHYANRPISNRRRLSARLTRSEANTLGSKRVFRSLKRRRTIWNDMERYGTIWNDMERYGTIWNDMERFAKCVKAEGKGQPGWPATPRRRLAMASSNEVPKPSPELRLRPSQKKGG
jgi:hypothetical protein